MTKKIREKGTMLGKIIVGETNHADIPFQDPNQVALVQDVSIKVKQLQNSIYTGILL